jgi:hypothetical protein
MNERITDLARQAGLIAPYGSDHRGLRDFNYMMFAELIVNDCIATVDSLELSIGPFVTDVIADHFGVK